MKNLLNFQNPFDSNMNPIGIQTMSSREIAKVTGKRHDHVLRDCDVLNEKYEKMGLPKIGCLLEIKELPNGGRKEYRYFELTKIQTFDLITGYDVELRIKVNRRWKELETKQVNFSVAELDHYRKSAKLRLEKSSRIKELDLLINEHLRERKILRRELNEIDRSDYLQLTLGSEFDNNQVFINNN